MRVLHVHVRRTVDCPLVVVVVEGGSNCDFFGVRVEVAEVGALLRVHHDTEPLRPQEDKRARLRSVSAGLRPVGAEARVLPVFRVDGVVELYGAVVLHGHCLERGKAVVVLAELVD